MATETRVPVSYLVPLDAVIKLDRIGQTMQISNRSELMRLVTEAGIEALEARISREQEEMQSAQPI